MINVLPLVGLSNSNGVTMKDYNLSWEASVDGTTWIPMLTTGIHRIYWLFAAPAMLPLYITALDRATSFASGANSIPSVAAAIRTGIRGMLSYDPADGINADPLTVFPDGKGICTDFGNVMTLLATSVGLHANPVMFWGGFQSLGKNIWVSLAGGFTNLINVRSPNPAYNPPPTLLSPNGWAFNYHVVSKVEGVLQDAALDRVGYDGQALHQGKIIHLLEIDNSVMSDGTMGAAYTQIVPRKDHIVQITTRDYGYPIGTSVFSTDVHNLELSMPAPPVINYPLVSCTVISGTLPPGLILDPNTGIISGTPTTRGAFHFRARLNAGGGLPTFEKD